MTFEEFQATRKTVNDLRTAIDDARWDENKIAPRGNVYFDALYIEEVGTDWPEAARKEGRFYLAIENMEWISDDLPKLERELYDWARYAGYFDAEKV